MAKIRELDQHVADLIAAGEVVERPASAVKELLENSIDAGAGVVTVEIDAGGLTFIRVTDNGCGMSPEDAEIAFRRHATSKLRDATGLEAIGTLGFRGEALAAVAAVSRIELITREQGAREGARVALEAGKIIDISAAGCPEGTTIVLRDLFFNTPARSKFMKSDRAESSAIASAVLRGALSRPEVSVRFIRDGKTEFHTPGDSRIDSCIYSLLGRDFAAGLIPAKSSDDAVGVEGYVSAPAASRGNRSYQFFFVNGRHIKSITLQAALEQAYANTLPSGRFPSCAIYITTNPGNVDVNVHPAKTEVKFVSDKQMFDSVYYAVQGALERASHEAGIGYEGSGRHPTIGSGANKAAPGAASRYPEPSARGRASKTGDGFKSMQVDEYRKKYASDGEKPCKPPVFRQPGAQGQNDSYGAPYRGAHGGQGMDAAPPTADDRTPDFDPPPARRARVIGEALNTYIIIEANAGVWFIDKHAAHERIHFNALRSGDYEPMSQTLIAPVVCRPGHEGAALLLENIETIDKLGFEIESFGEDAIAVRRIPEDIEIGDTEPVLSEICSKLTFGSAPDLECRDELYRAVACKAAIKAGKASDLREMEVLAARVLSGEITHCPHGRPVAFELTKAALDKSFKRT